MTGLFRLVYRVPIIPQREIVDWGVANSEMLRPRNDPCLFDDDQWAEISRKVATSGFLVLSYPPCISGFRPYTKHDLIQMGVFPGSLYAFVISPY